MAEMDLEWPCCTLWMLSLLGFGVWILYEIRSSWKLSAQPVPLVHRHFALAPKFALNLVFAWKAANLIECGYRKFKHRAFQLIRGDGNVIVLPSEMVAELSSLPASLASPHGALEHDLLGPLTGLNLILKSRLHHSIVQRKLTSRLRKITPFLEQELVSTIEDLMPECADWREIQPYQLFGDFSARMSARALVGPHLARSMVWLNIAKNYPENLFQTIVIARLFPTGLHRVLCLLLPSYWKCKTYLQSAKNLLSPIIDEMLSKDAINAERITDNDHDSLLDWLVDAAKGPDRDPQILAHIEVLLALASVHTTLLRMVNVLYDLTDNPDYFEELRQEIRQIERRGWSVSSYNQLDKLDSVLRESQRISPPTTIGMKRLFRESHTFSNGLRVPRGAYVCVATYAVENDPEHTQNPESFDGLRSYELRQQEGQENLHQFTDIEENILNFGFGKSACPGRFFAARVLKIVFVKMLCEYDFQFMHNTTRPRNFQVHEFLFPWPWDKILIKRRKGASAPF